jgi:hypothetical protein
LHKAKAFIHASMHETKLQRAMLEAGEEEKRVERGTTDISRVRVSPSSKI